MNEITVVHAPDVPPVLKDGTLLVSPAGAAFILLTDRHGWW